jgi:RNA polymerase sigma-70 factor (sigma-E family)
MSGDEQRRQVFDDFARARMPELLRFGYALTGSPQAAADLVQDALERTMLAWARVENQGDPEGYVRRSMVNLNISIWRRRRREILVDELPAHNGRSDVQPAATHRDLALWDRVKALPPRQRTVIVLRYYEDLPEDVVAATMGSAVGTVKSQMSRALAALRRDAAAFMEIDDGSSSARAAASTDTTGSMAKLCDRSTAVHQGHDIHKTRLTCQSIA